MALEIPQFQAPDFAGPIGVAMAMHERRQNAETQRMFAENQMRRQSAQDLRQQHEDAERDAERTRQHGIEQAQALGTIGQTLRTNPGAAMALGNAYGIDVHPLLGTTQAALTGPTQIDTSKQSLPSNDGSNELDPAGMGAPPEQQTEGPSDADLEGLMRRATAAPSPTSTNAVDRELAGSREESPQATPLLYEAVIGPHKYQLNAKPVSAFGDQKYDAQVQRFVDNGMDLASAQKLVLAQKEKDDNAQAIADRMRSSIDQRGDQQLRMRGEFNMTAAERMSENEKNRQNAQAVARIRAASAGAATPEERAALEHLARMKEQGAQDSEIAAAAAPGGLTNRGINPKVWEPLVATVTREANQNARTTERRAGLEATDENGNPIGGGVYKNAQAAAAGNKSEAAFAQLNTRLKALIDDVRAHGNRVLSSGEIQKRNSLFSAYTAAARVYNGLGGTDASQQLEHEIAGAAGTPGNGLLMGANPDVLEHLRSEAEAQHRARQKINVRSGNQALPAAVTHDKATGAAGTLTPAQKAALPDGWSIAQ